MLPLLNEHQRRLVGAAMVGVLGRGGQPRVSAAAGMWRNTLIVGVTELAGGAGPRNGFVVAVVVGRKRLTSTRIC